MVLHLHSDKTEEIIDICVSLEMSMSDIVNEVKSSCGVTILEAFQKVGTRIVELHRQGNVKATGIAQRWNSISSGNNLLNI